MSGKLPPVQQILQEIEPYMQRFGILTAVFVAITVWFFTTAPKKAQPVLDPVEWRGFKLIAKDKLSHNTARYRFGLPKPTDCLGLPIGQHISVSAEIDGKSVVRSYTPTTLDEDKGHFDLVVKTYEKGNISRYLSLLTIGQEVRVKGPKGKFVYTPTLTPHLLMIAGGSGITPMFQIIKSSVKDKEDKTKLALIYANVDEDDILLRKELEELRDQSNGRFTLFYTLNNPPANWSQGTGFVTKEMIETHMPSKSPGEEKVLMCGPPPMMTAMKVHLAQIGYPAPRALSKLEDQVFLF